MNSAVDLELYRIFLEIAHSRSFSAAAKRLYVSQSAVSQSMAKLESLLDTKLFSRGGRGVSLTPAGETLLGYVEQAMTLMAAGEDKLRKMQMLVTGELRIGASDTISKHFLLKYLDIFHTRYPAISLQVTNRTSTETFDLLASGALDFALVNTPVDQEHFIARNCLAIHDIFVAGSRYGELRRRTLTRAQLAQYPLIMLEKLSNTRRAVHRALLSSGVEVTPSIELGAHELLLEFAQIGLGVACVMKEFSLDYLQKGILFELNIADPLPPRAIAVCYAKKLPLSPAAERFIDILLQPGQQIV